jgi:hypothetical protein
MRVEMNQSGNSWLEFVQFFHKKNPELSYKQALQEASVPYNKMKKQHQQKRGGSLNIPLDNEKLRFEAGVSALNSNLKNIGRSVIFGGDVNIELRDPQMRFEAGVSALNSNLKNIGRSVIFGGKSRSKK